MSMLESHWSPICLIIPAILWGSPLSLIWDISLASREEIRWTVLSNNCSEEMLLPLSTLTISRNLLISFLRDIFLYFLTTFLAPWMVVVFLWCWGWHMLMVLSVRLSPVNWTSTGQLLRTPLPAAPSPLPSPLTAVLYCTVLYCTVHWATRHLTSRSFINNYQPLLTSKVLSRMWLALIYRREEGRVLPWWPPATLWCTCREVPHRDSDGKHTQIFTTDIVG